MSFGTSILPEFDQEMANTRKVLERIPDDKLDWKAHPKSNTIGWVGAHLAEIPGWVQGVLERETWDINPVGGEPYQTIKASSRQQLLELFDQNVATARGALASATDEAFIKEWSLLSQGQPILTMPRTTVIRSLVINHTIHHRAALCVYLRLNDIPVPGMYGPSGDE
ncbi:DinB family protein [Singulisphaera sp. Ch08]|uniref:DinB family protein n=1 Tax=Singulisphaera sp. Ch08 TaxID=3120278 RepID=A0AAU7CDC2_9BACT